MNAHPRRVDWAGLACCGILAAGALAVYAGTFSVPLHYDDGPSIADNRSIRHFSGALRPPVDATVGGRPFLNLTLAANYAVSGTGVWSYHVLNLAIHVLAGIALFGILRRTLAPRARENALAIALCASLLWVLHPLQTESVTYIIQRAESLMGLLYLLTLYFFIRGAEAAAGRRIAWYFGSVGACLLGMATKEVMVSAPLIVLLYDRTFLAGGFREAWRRRRGVYLWLAATWLVVPFLVLSTHGRSGTAGFGSSAPVPRYALSQFPAVTHYLGLCFWPHPLNFDYGTDLAPATLRILPYVLLVTVLVAATLWALVREPALGFLGAFFFAVLAPSSSIIPVATEVMAEHRMYLPLAAVVILVVLAIFAVLGRAAVPVCLALAVALGTAAARRNQVYSSEQALWADAVARVPGNSRAHVILGNALARLPGRSGEALAQFEEAVRLKPDSVEAHNNLGAAFSKLPGRLDDAIAQYEEALRLSPGYAETHFNLGLAWASVPGRESDGIAQLEEALRLKPDLTEAHINLGDALSRMPGRFDDAIAQFEEALRLDPRSPEAHNDLGVALVRAPGRLKEAVAQYEEALRLRPDFAEAHYNLGVALTTQPERTKDAISHLEEAVLLRPGYVAAHYRLGNLLATVPGRLDDAIAQYGEALRLNPDYAEAHFSLAVALLNSKGNLEEAKAHLEAGLRLHPDDAHARQLLDSLQRLNP
jgi:protein O-mannosyl-transferase